MNSKLCPGCGEEKALTEFYKNSKAKDGRQVRCRACHLEYAAANRERARERAAAWRRKRGMPERKRRKLSMGGPGTLFPEVKEER